MKKRITALFLALVMVFGLLPGSAFADVCSQGESKAEGPVAGQEVYLGSAPLLSTPSAITISVDESSLNGFALIDGKLVGNGTGSSFKMKAVDQNGDPTPVTWAKTLSTTNYDIDAETGVVTYSGALYGGGSSSSIWIQATSKLGGDTPVKSKDTNISAYGHMFSSYQKTQTVALSEDGQTAKTVSLTGGYSGHTVWTTDANAAMAEWTSDPGTGTSVKLNLYRPGTFTVTEKLDVNGDMTDTATVTVTGVAVEDTNGNRSKVYVDEGKTIQLAAFAASGRTIDSWSSSNEAVAKVSDSGLVTGVGAGSVIITAADSEGAKGGIKVVVESTTVPYFENLQFLPSAINNYTTVYQFASTTLEYYLPIKTYSTTKLTIQNTTLYNTDKYTATAAYTDANGSAQSVPVASGAISYLENIPFDASVVKITLADKTNAENKTVYTLNVTRPRDNTKVIKGTTGIVTVPDGRSLSTAKYNAQAEGTVFRADADGNPKTQTGAYSTTYYYRTYILGSDSKFALTFTGNTVYQRLRYSTDDGTTWTELPQGGGTTGLIAFPTVEKDNPVAKVTLQILDDATYCANVQAGKDGFASGTANTYTVWVERVNVDPTDIKMLTASTDVKNADSYPAKFDPNYTTYVYVVPNGTTSANLSYTVSTGASVTVGTSATAAGTEQKPAQDGSYKLALGTSAKYINVTKDGVTKQYNFKLQARSAKAYADKVVDFLCINSQYTNGVGFGNAATPWGTLQGTYSSLGNWGGYITYYFNEPLTDDPNNKYGMDFYAYGNSQENNIDSMAEAGQVWVSEDGSKWYALAGSEHYEDDVLWDYSVTYRKTTAGKTSWTDNQGNSNDGTSQSGDWVSPAVYYMNDLAKQDEITLNGILMYCQQGSIQGDSSTSSFAHKAKFGYVDYYANGTVGEDVNPYVAAPSKANGFDLEWAVDENGLPVDVSGKEFHYVKVVTASNIWAGAYNEKSTESAGVVRTTAQEIEVGRTAAPTGVTISDGAGSKTISFTEEQTVYSADLGDMKYVSVTVNGTDANDNIYINNQRGQTAAGIKVTKEMGEKLVRVIVQNGDKEPVIYLLKLTSSAASSDELIEGVKISVDGAGRAAETKDGETYTASVGYRVDSIGIVPVAAPDVTVTVSPEDVDGSYALAEGENTFTLTAGEQTVTLIVTRAAAPVSDGEITVYFTLKGDEKHGDTDEPHTMKHGGLTTWISRTAIKVNSPAVVLDVIEKALAGKYEFVNADGNYISEVNGLAAFNNGPFSGWMFTLNGVYPDFGIAEQSVEDGDRIVLHYTDDFNIEFDSGEWNGGSGKADVNEESAVQEETSAQSAFTDVPSDAYYTAAVDWAVEKDITAGIGNNKFGTGFDCTREQMVTFLWNLAGKPDVDGEKFSDVKSGSYYETAIAWAKGLGITAGKLDGSFGVGETVTREQVVTFLWNYAGKPEPKELASFSDVAPDAYYAKAVAWAKESGITAGIGSGRFGSGQPCTREQIITLMFNYYAEK